MKLEPVLHEQPYVICISGSTKFRDQILNSAKDLSLQGSVVVLPLVFGHSGHTITNEQKAALDQLHTQKIDMAFEMCVVCGIRSPLDGDRGYIGESTIQELKYAYDNELTIRIHTYLSSEKNNMEYLVTTLSKSLMPRFADVMRLFAPHSFATYEKLRNLGEVDRLITVGKVTVLVNGKVCRRTVYRDSRKYFIKENKQLKEIYYDITKRHWTV